MYIKEVTIRILLKSFNLLNWYYKDNNEKNHIQ